MLPQEASILVGMGRLRAASPIKTSCNIPAPWRLGARGEGLSI